MTTSREIQYTLDRINRILLRKRQMGHRDIRLGLDRIKRVVPDRQEWQGVHVGGTNGKGSICAFLGGLFKLAGVGYGSFNSPAFPDKHNAVLINGLYVNPRQYEIESKAVQAKWDQIAAGWQLHHGEDAETLSPFELETATAFRLFDRIRVPYGIVEVGMGGATDATNAMKHKAVTIISKIGLDHQEYLGNTIEKIAKVKAGIMQRNVPCIVDHTNQPSVLQVLREHAREVGTSLILTWKAEPFLMSLDNQKWKLENYQIQNLLCAAVAFRHLFPQKEIDLNRLMATNPFMPGRLEEIEILPSITGGESKTALVDGAHNMLGIEALVDHIDTRVRQSGKPMTWVMGMSSSKTKPFDKIIEKVVRPEDNLAFVEFAPEPNLPPPAPASFGSDIARGIVKSSEQVYDGEPEIKSALKWASEKAGEDPIVITGSLYLIKDLFGLQGIKRERQVGTRQATGPLGDHLAESSRAATSTDEDTSESPTTSDAETLEARNETSEARRKATFHKKQAKAYRNMMQVIQNDINAVKQEGNEMDAELSNLAARLADLDEQATKHEENYSAIASTVQMHDRSPSPSRRSKVKNPFQSGASLNPVSRDKAAKGSSRGSKIQEAAKKAADDQTKSPEQLEADKVAEMAKKEAQQQARKEAEEEKKQSVEQVEADPFAAIKGIRRDE